MNNLILENFKKIINLIIAENNQLTNKITDKKSIIINNFRIKSLKKIISIISKLEFEIKSSDDVKNIQGIGKSSIERIKEILATGKLAELKNYDRKIKTIESREKVIDDLMNIVGIGRIMANNLIDQYDIKSADELKKLSQSGKIELNDKIKLGLKYLGKFEGAIPNEEISIIYDYLQDLTDKFNPNMFITICGSYRRELPTSSDIDILLAHTGLITIDDIIKYSAIMNVNNNTDTNLLSSYVDFLHKENFLLDDITDKNIKTKYMGFGKYSGKTQGKIRRVDIRLIPMISYFPALLYFTGSYELNQKMRFNAKKLGYKLNEYGLYDLKTDEMIVVTSEQEIFELLKMNYLMPKER
jgi:DNA polymerase/3'-5' exonuclease PolX